MWAGLISSTLLKENKMRQMFQEQLFLMQLPWQRCHHRGYLSRWEESGKENGCGVLVPTPYPEPPHPEGTDGSQADTREPPASAWAAAKALQRLLLPPRQGSGYLGGISAGVNETPGFPQASCWDATLLAPSWGHQARHGGVLRGSRPSWCVLWPRVSLRLALMANWELAASWICSLSGMYTSQTLLAPRIWKLGQSPPLAFFLSLYCRTPQMLEDAAQPDPPSPCSSTLNYVLSSQPSASPLLLTILWVLSHN